MDSKDKIRHFYHHNVSTPYGTSIGHSIEVRYLLNIMVYLEKLVVLYLSLTFLGGNVSPGFNAPMYVDLVPYLLKYPLSHKGKEKNIRNSANQAKIAHFSRNLNT